MKLRAFYFLILFFYQPWGQISSEQVGPYVNQSECEAARITVPQTVNKAYVTVYTGDCYEAHQ